MAEKLDGIIVDGVEYKFPDGIDGMPINKEQTSVEEESVVFASDDGKKTYAKVTPQGVFAKNFYDLDGNPITAGSGSSSPTTPTPPTPTTSRKVLWLGTSIPEGCHYPEGACNNLGYKCYNKAVGSSGIIKTNDWNNNTGRDGKDLSETIAEKEARYRQYVNSGAITEAVLNKYKGWSYETLMMPYIDGTIDSCDTIVFDTGYNDRNLDDFRAIEQNIDSYDFRIDVADADFDRSKFIGAFRYLVKKAWEVNPNIKIIICSYLENITGKYKPNGDGTYTTLIPDYEGKKGYVLCEALKKIAARFGFPYLNMCDYNGFSMEYVPNTSNWLQNYNSANGTSYSLRKYIDRTNEMGNVTRFQMFCPDGTHPHTDKTGEALKRLTESITHLLRDL